VLGNSHSGLWEWFYTVGWGAAFLVTGNVIVLYARRRLVAVFFTAMFATWLIGGCLMAYGFSAAGPVFAHMFEPALDTQFRPLRQILASSLGDGPISYTQHYLASAVQSHVAVKGSGISAMPSMHIGATSIYVLAARRTPWLAPAVLFWLIIFVASGYFGYHYWVDGIVAAGVAWACWRISTNPGRRNNWRSCRKAPDLFLTKTLSSARGTHGAAGH
jgi:membrane-associated phospholipid phosphatase